MALVVKFKKSTYVFLIAIIGAFETSIIPNIGLPLYVQTFVGACIGAGAAYLTTEEQVVDMMMQKQRDP